MSENNELMVEIVDANEGLTEENDEMIVDNIMVDINPIEDKSFLIDLVNKMDARLSFVSKEEYKSSVWNRYQRIYYNQMKTNYVKCLYCNDVKKQTTKTGTATLLRHQCLRAADFETQFGQKLDQKEWQTNESFGCETNEKKTIKIKDITNDANESYNERNYLLSLLQTNDNSLSFEPQIGKSEVWTRFERILYTHIETDYVKCKECNEILKCNRYTGTTSLLRHRCGRSKGRRSGKKGTKRKIRTKRCATLEEKIGVENKTLKTIIKKCLEVIEKCLCINRTIILEKKQINVLINGYNEWLSENQDWEELDENKDHFEDIYGNNYFSEEESSLVDNECDDSSDRDIDYDPIKDEKPKSVLISSQRGLNAKNISIYASNLVKRKYKKRTAITSSGRTYPCDWPECGRIFKTSYNLKQHHDKHTGLVRHSYKCDWPGCDETFAQKSQYETHMCGHTSDKKFRCDFPDCQYESVRSTMLSRHKKVHSGERPHICDWPGCDFRTTHKNGLRHHKYRHTGEKPWKCSWPSCEWSFRQSTHLKAHMLKHTKEKPFQCQFDGCERRFASRQAMRFHSEKFHNCVVEIRNKSFAYNL